MKVIIAGSRSFNNFKLMCDIIEQLDWAISEVVSGTALGADRMGERWARNNSIPVKQMSADWKSYGRQAGLVRNNEMARYADALIAFWDGESHGTSNMILEAHRYNLHVHVQIFKLT